MEDTNVLPFKGAFLFLLFWFVSLLTMILQKTYSHCFFPVISMRYILINGASEIYSGGTGHVVSFKSCPSVSWSFHLPTSAWILSFLTSLPDMDLASFSSYQSWAAQWTQALTFLVLLHQQLSDSSGVYGHLCLFSFEGSLQFLPNLPFSCLAFLSFDNVSQVVPRILTLHNFPCTEMFSRAKLWLIVYEFCGLP